MPNDQICRDGIARVTLHVAVIATGSIRSRSSGLHEYLEYIITVGHRPKSALISVVARQTADIVAV